MAPACSQAIINAQETSHLLLKHIQHTKYVSLRRPIIAFFFISSSSSSFPSSCFSFSFFSQFPNLPNIQVVVVAKEIDSKTDLQQEESIPAEHRFVAPSNGPPQTAGTESHELWPQGRGDMPQIKGLNVKCEKNHMKVNIEFDRPFYGMVFSKGHYSDQKCVHLSPGTGHLTANFDIFLNACGMTSSETAVQPNGKEGSGLYIENTIIIQYDAQVQEIWDQARRLRCTWYDYYEKAVTFKTFNVDMLDAVTANFLGDNIQCWMQIQAGKGPWASEVAGIVKIGQTMTMVLAIKDDENRFDMLVRNCIAHDGKHTPIQLVDDNGCVIRPKIMSRFQKVKNFGHSATVVSYAYFQAFKFPDSMNVHFQCVIQVCRHECPEPNCDNPNAEREYQPALLGGERELEKVVSTGNRLVTAGSSRVPIYRPPPPASLSSPASPFPVGKGFMQRQGDLTPDPAHHTPDTADIADDKEVNLATGYAIAGTGGMPRALRHRRQLDAAIAATDGHLHDIQELAQEMFKNVQTEKVIQVVAPGDVSFSLLSDSGENVEEKGNSNATLVDIYSSRLSTDNSVCMSTSGLVGVIFFLLLLLVLSCLVAVFLFLRLRQISRVAYKCSDVMISYENPDFLKTFHGLAAVQLN